MRKRQMSGNDIEISEAGESLALQWPWPSKTVHVLIHIQIDGSRTAWMSTKCKSVKRTGEVLLLFLSRWGIITLKCLVLELYAWCWNCMLVESAVLCGRRIVYKDENEFRVCLLFSGVLYLRRSNSPGTITSSFFLVRSRSNRTSSSLSSSSTRLPAAPRNFHTAPATSSALCIPLSFL
jgi:hypothetical protein